MDQSDLLQHILQELNKIGRDVHELRVDINGLKLEMEEFRHIEDIVTKSSDAILEEIRRIE